MVPVTSEGKLEQLVRVRRALYYGRVGLMVRWREHVVALEGYGGCVDLYSGTQVGGSELLGLDDVLAGVRVLSPVLRMK